MYSQKHDIEENQEMTLPSDKSQNCDQDHQNSRNVFLQKLKNILTTNQEDDVNLLKEIFVQADKLKKVESYTEADISTHLQGTNLVILACKLNRPNVLRYFFSNKDTLSRIIGGFPLPVHEDEQQHNAFYYAIRNDNVDVLKTLCFKWPGCNFSARSKEFIMLVLKSYHELILKNVEVSQEVKVFTESISMYNHYHFKSCCSSSNVEAIENSISNGEQIDTIIKHINSLVSAYNDKEIDDVCLLSMKFTAFSLSNLGDFNSVHSKLQCQEIIFLLFAFIQTKIYPPDPRFIYCSVLTKRKILGYLNEFSNSLARNTADFQSPERSNVLNLLHNVNQNKQTSIFHEMNYEHDSIKNAFVLYNMKCYLEAVESAGTEWEYFFLLLTRCLQVLRANVVEFPKLSHITCEFLLQAVSKSTRGILLCKCNPKLCVSSISKDSKCVNDLFKDMCKLNHILANILNEIKIHALVRLLENVINETCLNNVKEFLDRLDTIILDVILPNTDMILLKQVQKFIIQFNILVTDKTLYEEELLNNIQEFLDDEKSNQQSKNVEMAISRLQYLKFYIRGKNMTDADFIHIKHTANQILQYLQPQKVCKSVQSIIEMILKIWNSIVPRMQNGANKLYNIILHILKITELHTGQTLWVNELWNKLNSTYFSSECENRGNINDIKCKHGKVSSKLNTSTFDVVSKLVPSIFGNSDNFLHHLEMNTEIFNDFLCYQNNKCIQAVVETLVIDELHSLQKEPTIISPWSFQEEGFILQGERLYDFLRKNNILIDSYFSDPSASTFINAMLICHGILLSEKENHQEVMVNRFAKAYTNYTIDKNTIANQNNMFTALTKGELETVERCIKKGADINGKNCNLWSSLHFAAQGGSVEAIKYLLDQKMSVNVKDINGQNPLHTAVKCGRKNIVEYLINEINISINETDNMGKTPFLFAIQNGCEDIVLWLLKSEFNTFSSDIKPSICKIFCDSSVQVLSDQESEFNYNAVDIFISLYSAAGSGCAKLMDGLLANKCNIKIKHHILGTPLHIAAEKGFVQAVKYLISKGFSVHDQNGEDCTPLHLAVRNGHDQVVRLLLEEGSNVNMTEKILNYTPLRYAVQGGYVQIIKLLLENGAGMNDMCREGRSSFHSAVLKGNMNSMHVLIKNGASVNAASKNGSTGLHLSAVKDNKEIVTFLIRNGGNVNAQNEKNQTVLHVASENNCQEICRILMSEGGNVNAKDMQGFTPLHLSCRRGHISTIRLLLEKGADVNARDKHERTSLHIVALYDVCNAIEILTEKGININCRDKDGFTALHLASLKGNVKSVEKLISKKANVNATDFKDVSPLHLAVQANHIDVVKILIQSGSFIDAKVTINNNSCLNKGATNWVEKFQKELLEVMVKDVPELQTIFLKRYGNKWTEDTRVLTPLYLAEFNNNPAITSLLLSKGAKIWVRGSLCLMTSTYFGYKQIVKIILEKSRNQIAPKNETPNFLFVASFKGHVEIVKLLLSMGLSKPSSTLLCSPLYAAAERGHYEIVKLLLDKNANANLIDSFGTTPLHRAAALGHKKIVELFLESKVVPAHSRDLVNTTPLEQAAATGHVEIAEMLLKERKVKINEKGKDDYTVLHIAAQEGHLDMVKFLVSKGANVTASNSKGSNPIHVAAREGHVKTVQFFLNIGLDINIRGHCEQTCLHYAVQAGQILTVNFLLQQNIDVNVADTYGMTALHMAVIMYHKNLVKVLLEHGAYYNVVDKINKATPLQMARNEDMCNIFLAVEKLFRAVKIDSLRLVEESIQDGVVINAKNKDNVTALLFAAWKGYSNIVDILLSNSANPNISGKGGCSPLHYATKFSHLKIVKTLLANGAVYNFKNKEQKTPLDFAINQDITHLLTLVDKLFSYAENGNMKLISELKMVHEIDTMKAILNACNERKEIIIDCANRNEYPFNDELQKICKTSVSMNLAKKFFASKKYEEGLNILFNR
ncbi:hypothetical protein R5R35_011892 [Gryllus longicercus]|uniref:Uncharacterized protein n=1 Tax=Gryllus longicercus TaxID=2509291 RepID=A0AAN9VYJ3_9ORTH